MTIDPIRYTKPYYEAFIIAMVAMWLPSKMIGYIVPFICMGWFILRANSGKSLLRVIAVLILFSAVICFFWLYYSTTAGSYLIAASVLSIITYSSFLFMAVMPGNLSLDKPYYFKIIQVVKIIILFEGCVGILQYIAACIVRKDLDESVGDVVQGTIYPLAFLEKGDMGFGNLIFAINMVFLLIFFIPYVINHKKGRFIAFIGLLSFFLTVASHIIISLFVAVFLTWLIFQKFSSKLRKSTLSITAVAALSLFIFYQFSPRNFTLAVNYWNRYTEFRSLKVIATLDFTDKLQRDYPASLFMGLGPGQYSSRAGLILSGRYFGGSYDKPKKLPFIPVQLSQPFKKFGLDTFIEYLRNPTYGSSTMSRPFYSILSILSEFGMIVLILLFLFVFNYIRKLKMYYKGKLNLKLSVDSYNIFACSVAIFFLIMLCFFENYLEVPQAIFPGLMILRIFYSAFGSFKYTLD